MATSKAAPKPAEAQPASGGSRKTLILVIAGAALLLLLMAGGGAWFYFTKLAGNGEHAEAKKEEPAKPPVFLTMESFTVNLQPDDGMQQYLQVAMSLQVSDQATADLLKLHMPQVRNRLLLLLSSKKSADILSTDGKKKLSSEIIEQLKEPYASNGPRPDVSDVFFTSFVIQ